MELRQLEYFVAVAEEAGFTRAADRVHISQSGVSAQIRHLERELGAPLIDRSTRTAALTSAGAAALEPARAVLAAVAAVREAVDQVNGLLRGRLVVGMVTACTVGPLFDALAEFHRAHPGVQIALVEDTSDQLVARVRAGTADLALIGAAGSPPADLHAFPVVTEPIVAAVPSGHPLLDRPDAALRDVTAHPLVCLPEGTGIRAALDRACAAHGLRPAVAFTASAPTTVADLAARGLGVAVLSRSMVAALADRPEGRLHPVPVVDADTSAVLALVWGRDGGPALGEFLGIARRCFTAVPVAAPALTAR